ncbi:MAG: serine hydrolase domain-containing protein [Saccharofermentanales bacterium]
MPIEKIEQLLNKSAKKAKTLQFAMNVPTLGVNYSFSSTVPNQRFHSASVGKLMTATLIFMAIEQEKLTLETRVNSILEQEKLDRLFVFKDVDYQGEVTVKHLLGHTSGINDYFESKTFDGSSFTDEMINNPDTFWTPEDLLNYTRDRQNAIAKPGEKFLYSDTGYILLGLIVEAVFGMPFHRALENNLFQPADMQDTHLCFYSEGFDQKALAPGYINGVDVHLFRSLSADFSGGGLSTTADDILKYLDFLQNERFVSQKSLDRMGSFDHRYVQGLHYGLGMMQVRFEGFFFLLKNLPRLQGHLGVTGVHAWYDPKSKATFALNVGNTKDMAASFRLLIKIIQILLK